MVCAGRWSVIVRGRWGAEFVAVLVVLLVGVGSASAAGPVWQLDALANSSAAPGGTLAFLVQVGNVGAAGANGSSDPVVLTGTLPAGLSIVSVTDESGDTWDCSTLVVGAQTFTCEFHATVPSGSPSGSFRALSVLTAVGPAASGLVTARFDVSGGGAAVGASTVASGTVSTSAAVFGISAFDAQVTADALGTPYTQAGGHPFEATTTINFNTYRNADPEKGDLTPVEPVKDITVDLPAGFVGDPSGLGRCSLAQLSYTEFIASKPSCPPDSQVGTTLIRTFGSRLAWGPIPVYNMDPPSDAPARFGFNALGTVVTLDVTVRTGGDYGLSARLRNVSEGLTAASASLTLWGVPGDPVHDPERACVGVLAPWQGGPTCSAGTAVTALLRNPTSCPPAGTGLATVLSVDSWFHPDAVVQQTVFSHLPPGYPFPTAQWGAQQGTTGCEQVPFDPSFSAAPDSTVAGAPTGFSFDITLPQSSDPAAIDEADVKKVVVSMPAGVRLSTSAAAGLAGCSPAQVALDSAAPAACPAESKIGTVEVRAPAVRDPLEGSVYLATPHDNPFGSLVGLYLVASGSGVTLKLPGQVSLDPSSGQVTTTFDNNPQLPFSSLHLALDGGARAPLANPVACGTYTTHADLTSWSGKTVSADSSFAITADGNGAPCPANSFAPGFTAGTESPVAGTSSPFELQITRPDTSPDLGGLQLHTPPGLTGKIASVVLCSNADANAGTCPPASKIGDVTVGAGSGPNPFYITNGGLYLTGPYKGAPFGLSVVVPAIAGPFNLGNVVVRQAITVDKHTAALSVASDPLPTILQGITLGVRDIRVSIDKPGFFLNPTSCAQQTIAATITAATGQTKAVSQRYQAAECASLAFKPSMALAVGGKGHLRTGDPTPLSTRITMPAGQANIRYVRVTLPSTINARLTVIDDACTRAQFETDIAKCAHAQAGTAVAVTPLLRDPLRGNVYFVRNGHPIPDLFVALRGQVDFDLIGRVTIPGGKKLATTFSTAPDVPIKSFKLHLYGDNKHGSVGAAANLCTTTSKKATAALDFIGQNGRVLQVDQRLLIHGCPKPKQKARSRG